MSEEQKEESPSFFKSIINASQALMEEQIYKAKHSIQKLSDEDPEDLFYAKTLTQDPSYSIHSQGFMEKPNRIQNAHLKQMSIKSSVVSSIIQTRQNQVSTFSSICETGKEKGWRIKIKDEKRLLEEIKAEIQANPKTAITPKNSELDSTTPNTKIDKDDAGEANWDLDREAAKILSEQLCEAKCDVESFIQDCGLKENRPFISRRWNLDQALRAWVRDTLTFDMYASEIVSDQAGRPHHFIPVDASTIKFSSPALQLAALPDGLPQIELDILYPESEAKQISDQRILEMDEELLAQDKYKYVQVVRGRVERAYTEDELKIGIRNPTTDIYNNGYGVSELELLVSLVTGHLNSEYYNQSYFTQGFSAKGILHIKSNINRRKLASVREAWQHMLRGSRNSFQTPIIAGVDGIEWVKLDQNHQDIGFEHWMRYLIKLICSIYQIDPSELGIGFKEEGGGSGGGLSGDNTAEKLDNSREKGLFPLLKHIQGYINTSIVEVLDPRFEFEFTGVTNETSEDELSRLERLSKFAYTVNEVRKDLGKPPIPRFDNIILNREFLDWLATVEGVDLNHNFIEDGEKSDKSPKSGSDAKKDSTPKVEVKPATESISKADKMRVEFFDV